jgi:Flp pilus assembly protein TadD
MGTIRRQQRSRPTVRTSVPAATVAAPPAGGDANATAWRDFIFQCAVIVLAGLWVYSPTYHGDWLWDDDQLLTQNLTVQHRVDPDPRVPPNALKSLVKLWVSPDGADYFPLSYTALWAQWPFFQMDPRTGGPVEPDGPAVAWPTGYHVVTILGHIAGALLFWRLLRVMRLPGAWLGGLLFAIHPVCVETVGWVSEVKNTLSQPLFLLACCFFVEYDDDRAGSRAPLHYLLAVLFFLLAMFAKTAVVMFPFVILAYGWWKHGFRVGPRDILALALAGASLALTVVPELVWMNALRAGKSSWGLWTTCGVVALLGPITSALLVMFLLSTAEPATPDERPAGRPTLERYTLDALPFLWISAVLGLATCYFQWSRAIGQEAIPVGGIASRIATAGMAIVFYLWKAVWPFGLMTIYPRWEVDPPQVWQFLPWPLMAAAVWWLWSQRGTAAQPTWQRHLLFVLGFFVLMLFPILGFITISYMRITWVADHFLYLPMISVIGFAAAAVATAYDRLSKAEQPMALAVGALMLGVLGLSSFRYAHAWAGEEALWPHTIKGHPAPCTYRQCGCWQAHNRLGAKKFARGDVESAHFHFQNSTRLRPDLGETHNNLGTTHSARAQMAAQQGNQEAAKREMDLAIEQFREACRVTPHVPAIQVNYANSLAASGRFVEAAEQYKQLLDKMPENPAMWNNYGVALFKQGDTEQAIVAFRKALDIDPNLKDAKESLAVATGEKPMPQAPPPPGGQLQLNLPQSPTLGPVPLQR